MESRFNSDRDLGDSDSNLLVQLANGTERTAYEAAQDDRARREKGVAGSYDKVVAHGT